MNALILNDTRNGQHLGCIIVMQQLAALARQTGIEPVAMLRLGRNFQDQVGQGLARCDVVIINGEGTMHHDAAGAMAIVRAGQLAASRGVPIALVNTVWQDNLLANQLLPLCRWIHARESLSQAAITQLGFRASVVPDLTLTADPEQLFPAPQAPQGVVVMDDVRLELSLALARYARGRHLPFHPMGARGSLRTRKGWSKMLRMGLASGWAPQFHAGQLAAIQRASVVVTGRFHGICLAILAKRPFVAFASNTHKIEGLLRDAALGPGGRLFNDPPADPAQRDAYIDDALRQVLDHMEVADQRAAYEAACSRYAQQARQAAQAMLTDICQAG